MSLVTRGLGEGEGFITFGFGEIIVTIPIPIVVEDKRLRVRRVYVTLHIPVRGIVAIPVQLTIHAFSILHQRIKTSLDIFGGLKTDFVKEFDVIASLQKPIILFITCTSGLKTEITERFLVHGKKAYQRLKLLFFVLEDE